MIPINRWSYGTPINIEEISVTAVSFSVLQKLLPMPWKHCVEPCERRNQLRKIGGQRPECRNAKVVAGPAGPACCLPIHLRPMRLLLPLLSCLLILHVHAQEDPRLFKPAEPAPAVRPALAPPKAWRPDTAAQDSVKPGKVTVVESDKIKAQMANYAAHTRQLEGFRVQIFNGDRNTAESMRRAFMVGHPDIPAYLSYLAPNFRVRVGDLRDRVAAERMREDLRGEYPGLYVVPEQIEPPRLKTER